MVPRGLIPTCRMARTKDLRSVPCSASIRCVVVAISPPSLLPNLSVIPGQFFHTLHHPMFAPGGAIY